MKFLQIKNLSFYYSVHDEQTEEVKKYKALDDISLEKLNVLVKSNDGFYIAEKDLELRGPGEIASVNQSGLPSFRYVNLISDFEMFKYAKADAEAILKNSDKKDNEVIIEHAKYLLQTKGFLNA